MSSSSYNPTGEPERSISTAEASALVVARIARMNVELTAMSLADNRCQYGTCIHAPEDYKKLPERFGVTEKAILALFATAVQP